MICGLMADVLWILQGHFEGGHESGAVSNSSSDDAPLSLWQQDMSRWAPEAEVFMQQQGRSGEAAINVQKLAEITSIHRQIDRVRGTRMKASRSGCCWASLASRVISRRLILRRNVYLGEKIL